MTRDGPDNPARPPPGVDRVGQLEARVAERTRALAEANETLHKSERRFRALIEHGSDALVLERSAA